MTLGPNQCIMEMKLDFIGLERTATGAETSAPGFKMNKNYVTIRLCKYIRNT